MSRRIIKYYLFSEIETSRLIENGLTILVCGIGAALLFGVCFAAYIVGGDRPIWAIFIPPIFIFAVMVNSFIDIIRIIKTAKKETKFETNFQGLVREEKGK